MGWARVPKALPDLVTFYAGATPPEPPTLSSPMQGLTAHAAALTARLAGCRLPTSAEWAAARAKGDSATPNLRDQSWKRMFDRLRAADPNAVLALTSDVFRLTPVQGGDVVDAEPAVQSDDGTVWFRPVDRAEASGAGSSTPFRDLVGNVAELVFEDPASLEQVAPTRAAIAAAVTGDKLRVVGGSALSPAAVNPTDVQKFPGNPVTRRYSDLGFRLAFTAPRAAGAAGASERLGQALAAHGYVGGP
jgi:formylglycine-generating enzyme required for sulfatase activity